MFGYIKPFKPDLRMCEYDVYKGIYCGLCKELSRSFSVFSSLTLSYDFTFIATIALSLKDDNTKFSNKRCTANPFCKKKCVQTSNEIEFCASVAVLMLYYKLIDDIKDKNAAYKLLLPFFKLARRKALKRYANIDSIISNAMLLQSDVEKEHQSIDCSANPTATALSHILPYLSDNVNQKIILERFGYILGRYVYFADALDDLEDDMKTGSYNPFIDNTKSLSQIKEYAVEVINLTIGELAPAYELLDIKRYKGILDNTIYLGLHSVIKEITSKAKQDRKTS